MNIRLRKFIFWSGLYSGCLSMLGIITLSQVWAPELITGKSVDTKLGIFYTILWTILIFLGLAYNFYSSHMDTTGLCAEDKKTESIIEEPVENRFELLDL